MRKTLTLSDDFYGELHGVLLEILSAEAPQETEIMRKLGPGILKQSVEAEDARGMRGVSFEFSALVEGGIIAAKLIAATASLIQAYVTIRKMKDEQTTRSELMQQFEKLLLKEGMPPEVARKVLKHSGTLVNSLLKYRTRKTRGH